MGVVDCAFPPTPEQATTQHTLAISNAALATCVAADGAKMIVTFGLLVRVPLLLSDPRDRTNWSENVETFAIAGTAWILADLLGECRLTDHRTR